MPGFSSGNGRRLYGSTSVNSSGVSYDSASSTLFAAMDVSLSDTDKSAVDAAIVSMKAESIWTELDWFNFALATEQ